MKKHAVASICLLLLLSTVSVAADWSQVFSDTFFAKGVDEAVVNALSEGITPELIVQTALPLQGMKQEELIKALYCALVPPPYIHDAASVNKITDETVQNGYELALQQCAEAMEEKENSLPVFPPRRGGLPSGGLPSGGTTPADEPRPASPSDFR